MNRLYYVWIKWKTDDLMSVLIWSIKHNLLLFLFQGSLEKLMWRFITLFYTILFCVFYFRIWDIYLDVLYFVWHSNNKSVYYIYIISVAHIKFFFRGFWPLNLHHRVRYWYRIFTGEGGFNPFLFVLVTSIKFMKIVSFRLPLLSLHWW